MIPLACHGIMAIVCHEILQLTQVLSQFTSQNHRKIITKVIKVVKALEIMEAVIIVL
jgi:hypothetical protein